MAVDYSYGKYIDHTVLKLDTSRETIKRFCDEAKAYGFAAVCVHGGNIPFVVEQLKGSGVKAATTVGFPFGANSTAVKVFEAKDAIANGAEEIDMVMNVAALKEGRLDVAEEDIRAVVEACHPKALVKVILETSELTDEEIVAACRICVAAKADFVKTSTGFASGGATVHAVRLMKQTVGDACKVKASTGINNRSICDEMIDAGAERMGTSKGIIIVEDK